MTMTDDQRDAFINMAENLGIDPGDAEDMVDLYLEEIERTGRAHRRRSQSPSSLPRRPSASANGRRSPRVRRTEVADAESTSTAERAQYPNFASSIGTEMLLVPSGVFRMGSDAADAAPNERPITQVTLSCYYLSRHPITNAQYRVV